MMSLALELDEKYRMMIHFPFFCKTENFRKIFWIIVTFFCAAFFYKVLLMAPFDVRAVLY